jgi:hypothetical protein
MEASNTFWFLWVLTALLLAWPLYVAWQQPTRMLELPFIVSVFGSYFFVYLPYQATVYLIQYIDPRTLDIGQFVIVLCLTALFAGWYWALRKRPRGAVRKPGKSGQESLAFWVGQTLCWLGVAVHVLWQLSGLGYETSAYYYMFSYCVYPGVGLCVMAMLRDRSRRTVLKWVITILPAAYLVLPQIMGARRGPTIAWGVLFLGASALSGRIRFRFWVGVGSLIGLGLLTLTFIPARSYLAENSNIIEALQQTSVADAVTHKSREVSDNEFVYHCAVVATVHETGLYQYGTKLLMLMVHWIPREIWSSKPDRGAGLRHRDRDLKAELSQLTGVDMGPGMSAAGFADPFEDFGYFCPIFWFVLGVIATRVYRRARDTDSLLWKGAWLNIFACGHWLIAQDFGAFLVPMMIAQVTMLLVWFIYSKVLRVGSGIDSRSLAVRRSRSYSQRAALHK